MVGNSSVGVGSGSGVVREAVGMLESQSLVARLGVEGRTTCGEFSINRTFFERITRLVMGSKHRKPLV